MSNPVVMLAEKLVKDLKPFSKKIEIVGSIRRKEENPRDIDIVLIPKNKEKLEEFMRTKGKYIQGGEHESTWKIRGFSSSGLSKVRSFWCKVELYYTNEEEWGAELVAYSSRKGAGDWFKNYCKEKRFEINSARFV